MSQDTAIKAVTANAGTNLNTSLLALESGGNLAAAVTALQIMDDWDESDRAKVNLIVGQAGITAGAGSVAANTPRVTHASDDPVTTALQIMDDWDESDRAKVNIIVGQAGVDGGSGTVSAATQRVCIATNTSLPAGTNNIGDVDVLTLPVFPNKQGSSTIVMTNTANNYEQGVTGYGTSIAQITGTWTGTIVAEGSCDESTTWVALPMVNQATGANVTSTTANGNFWIPIAGLTDLRLRCSVTGSGTANVTLNEVSMGGFSNVTGQLTANAGTNLNTSLLALESGGNLAAAVTALQIMDDWDESDRAKVNLIVGQAGITAGAGSVAANTPRVTHASDDPVTTALQIMDDWDESDRAKVNIIVGQAGVAAGSGAIGATVQRVCIATDTYMPTRAVTGPARQTIAFGSITGAYQTLITNSATLRYLRVENTLNVGCFVSLDASTDWVVVTAGQTKEWFFGAAGLSHSGNVSIKATGPISGSVVGECFTGP